MGIILSSSYQAYALAGKNGEENLFTADIHRIAPYFQFIKTYSKKFIKEICSQYDK